MTHFSLLILFYAILQIGIQLFVGALPQVEVVEYFVEVHKYYGAFSQSVTIVAEPVRKGKILPIGVGKAMRLFVIYEKELYGEGAKLIIFPRRNIAEDIGAGRRLYPLGFSVYGDGKVLP